jgi:hypothetical protein
VTHKRRTQRGAAADRASPTRRATRPCSCADEPAEGERGRFCETDSGSADGATKLLELQQHCERSLQLSIEMDFVAGKMFELMRIERLTESLSANERPVFYLPLPLAVPGQRLAFKKSL